MVEALQHANCAPSCHFSQGATSFTSVGCYLTLIQVPLNVQAAFVFWPDLIIMTPSGEAHSWLPTIMFKRLCWGLWWRVDYNTLLVCMKKRVDFAVLCLQYLRLCNVDGALCLVKNCVIFCGLHSHFCERQLLFLRSRLLHHIGSSSRRCWCLRRAGCVSASVCVQEEWMYFEEFYFMPLYFVLGTPWAPPTLPSLPCCVPCTPTSLLTALTIGEASTQWCILCYHVILPKKGIKPTITVTSTTTTTTFTTAPPAVWNL